MAATLLSIKSRMMLPKSPVAADEEEEEDPRKELVERLLAYLQGVVPAFEQRLLSEAVPYLIQLARQLMVGVAHLLIVVPHWQLGGFERFYYQY